jgi:hypothetical protein
MLRGPRRAGATSPVSPHRPQTLRKRLRRHQRLAPRKPSISIFPEIICRIVIRQLDQAPQRPQQITHGLVNHHAALIGGQDITTKIGPHHLGILSLSEPCFNRKITQVPHRIIHAGVFPIDNPHPLAIIKKILAERITVARHQRHIRPRQCSAKSFRLRHHILIALRQIHSLASENPQVIIDHRKQFKAKWKRAARCVQTAQSQSRPRR